VRCTNPNSCTVSTAPPVDPCNGVSKYTFASIGINSSSFENAVVLNKNSQSAEVIFSGFKDDGNSVQESFLLKTRERVNNLATEFGNNGIVNFSPTQLQGPLGILFIDNNNRLVTAGTNSDLKIARLSAQSGALDANFGSGGIAGPFAAPANYSNPIFSNAQSLASGKYLFSGTAQSGASWHSFLMRINENGSLDSSFGQNGYLVFSNSYKHTKIVDFQIEGPRIVTAGFVWITSNGEDVLYGMVARYNENGVVDSSFNSGNILLSGQGQDLKALRILKDGKYLVAGKFGTQGTLVGRILGNGTWDSSFGVDGKKLILQTMAPAYAMSAASSEVGCTNRFFLAGVFGTMTGVTEISLNGEMVNEFLSAGTPSILLVGSNPNVFSNNFTSAVTVSSPTHDGVYVGSSLNNRATAYCIDSRKAFQ
jgi:uncharacterized delta-60 repeat protein